MLSENNKQDIIKKINEKNIKKSHQKYILNYIEMNTELFNNLNIEEVIQAVLENFNGVSLNITSFLYQDYGQYNPTTGKVLLSPKLFHGKNRKYRESVMYHELDHCACTPIELKKQYNDYKNKIKQKHKYLYRIIPNFILSELFLKVQYEGPLSGIASLERKKGYTIQKLLYGSPMQNYLNEGITFLKQKMYSDKLNIKFHEKKDFLYGAEKAAECIASVIGLENMIYLHFYHKLEEIINSFYTKTGVELNTLLVKCMEYDRKRTKKTLKQLNNYIMQICEKSSKN